MRRETLWRTLSDTFRCTSPSSLPLAVTVTPERGRLRGSNGVSAGGCGGKRSPRTRTRASLVWPDRVALPPPTACGHSAERADLQERIWRRRSELNRWWRFCSR